MSQKLLIILLLLTSMQAWAQNVLTREANGLGDSLQISCQRMGVCGPGYAGKGEIWDFSSVDYSKEPYDILLTKDSLSHYHKIEGMAKYSYVMRADTLEQYKFEDRLTKIKYFKKKLAMRYPFQYGDSISSLFEGYGKYCGDHLIRVKGQVVVQADGMGELILSERDTLNNVLRVYTLTTTAMAMNIGRVRIDSTNLKQEIEEKYEWYGRGFRYPLYTIVQKTSFTNLQPVGSTTLAYRILPEDLASVKDAHNDSIRNSDASHNNTENTTDKDIFHYHVRNDQGGIDINYTSDADANVTTLVSSNSGILYKRQSCTIKAGDTGNIHLSTAGMPFGQYILYINVNGKIYSHVVNVK